MAISLLETADMGLYVAAAKRQKGRFTGGDEGEKLVREADDWFTGQGVENPAKFADFLVPGFS